MSANDVITAFVLVFLLFGGAISIVAGTIFGEIYPTLVGVACLIFFTFVGRVLDGLVSISEVMITLGLMLVCVTIVFGKSRIAALAAKMWRMICT